MGRTGQPGQLIRDLQQMKRDLEWLKVRFAQGGGGGGGGGGPHAATHASGGSDPVNHNSLLNVGVGDVHTQYALADRSRPNPWIVAADLNPLSLADLGTRNHSDLSVGADAHPEYVRVLGRSGSTIIDGSPDAGGFLALRANAAETAGGQGLISLLSRIRINNNGYNALGITHLEYTGTLTLTGTAGPNQATVRAIDHKPTVNFTNATPGAPFVLFSANGTFQSSIAVNAGAGQVLFFGPTFSFPVGSNVNIRCLIDNAIFANVASAANTQNLHTTVESTARMGRNWDVLIWRSVHAKEFSTTTVGGGGASSAAGQVRDYVVVDVDAGLDPWVSQGFWVIRSLSSKAITEHLGRARFGAVGTPTTTMDVRGGLATGVTSKNAPYTMAVTDSVVLCDTSSQNVQITLPTAATTGHRVTIIKSAGDLNEVQVQAAGGQSIAHGGTVALQRVGDRAELVADGATTWHLVTGPPSAYVKFVAAGNYTMTDRDQVLLITPSFGGNDVTLPAIGAKTGHRVTIVRVGADPSNQIRVSPAGSDQLEPLITPPYVMTGIGDTVEFIADGGLTGGARRWYRVTRQ